MRFSTHVYLSLLLVSFVAAHPLPREDDLVLRSDTWQPLEARIFGKDKSDTPTEKEGKDGKAPKYKDAAKKPPPKYNPGGHPQNDFHSTHDPAAGTGRKDGSSRRDVSWEDVEARVFGKDKSDTPTEKEGKDGKAPKYKDAAKKPPPKYNPGGHPQNDFHSTHDPAAGTGRKDGSSRRDLSWDDLEARMFGKDKSDTPTEKEGKDGKAPKYKDAAKKPPPKYNPGGHPQNDFHSTHDPAAGTGRKDGSSRRDLSWADLEARVFGKDKSDTPTEKEGKDGKAPKYKDAAKKPPPKYNPGGHPQNEFHSTHDPAAGTGRKDGSS